MVKSVLGVNHQGLRDWMIQRASAIIMALYSIWLIGYILSHPGISFAEWHSLFSHPWVKITSLLFLLALLYHAWIGVWTTLTDYVKPFILRCVLNFLILLMLFTCFFWGMLVLWSV